MALSEMGIHGENSAWTIAFDGFDSKRESHIHTLLCTGNGMIGIRGSIPELNHDNSQGIYLAGFYDKLTRPVQDPSSWSAFVKSWSYMDLAEGQQIETCLVKCPDFLDMNWTLDGERIDFTTGRLISLKRRLPLVRLGAASAVYTDYYRAL